VFADPSRSTATAVLQTYPSARAIRTAGVDAIAAILRAAAPRNDGRETAQQLVALASQSVSSGLAVEARKLSLKIWCEHLHQTQMHLKQIEQEIDRLLVQDPHSQRFQQIPEFGTKTMAVLRAELGDVARFQRLDQVIAYGGHGH